MSNEDDNNQNQLNEKKPDSENKPDEPEKSLRERVLESLKYRENLDQNPEKNTGVPFLEKQKEQLGEMQETKESSVAKEQTNIQNNQLNTNSQSNESISNEEVDQVETPQSDRQPPEVLGSRIDRQGEAPSEVISENASEKELEKMKRRRTREKENKLVTKIVLFVVTSLVIILVVLGFSLYKYWQAGLEPLDPKSEKLVQVNIPIGTSNKGIGSILENDKVIKSGLVFTYHMKTENITDFKGGYYQMSANMTLGEIASMLQKGGTEEPEALADARMSIPEGYSVDQIADMYAEKTPIKKEEFMAVLADADFFTTLYNDYPMLLESAKNAQEVRYRLEGYLFPATYNYYKDKTAQEIVREMVDKTNTEFIGKEQAIAQSGMTIQQVLTLASLVEKEGVEELDRRNIAQVFLNRIDAEMPLQSDISVLYAMDEHKVHLSNKDTEFDSPYNLYLNKGYGPGPFNNPGLESINAVLNPEPNNYYYFLADIKTHKVYFAETYEEHLELKEKHIDSQME